MVEAGAHIDEAVGFGDAAQGAVPAEKRELGVRGGVAVFAGVGGVAVGVVFVGGDDSAGAVGQEHGAAEVVGVVGFGVVAGDFIFEAVGAPDVIGGDSVFGAHEHAAERGVGVVDV